VLARGSILKAIAMIVLGILLSTGRHGSRDRPGAHDAFGLQFSPTASTCGARMGSSASPRSCATWSTRNPATWSGRRSAGCCPNWDDVQAVRRPGAARTSSARRSASLPGNGAVLGPFASYTVEKKLAKDPRRFGRGAIEGVAGPESANNAGAQTSFIPLLTLGIPPNAVMALMVGAMTIHGIIPGPQVMTKNPNLFWGMIASMWVGNLMLLIINLPLIGLWVRLLKVPYRLMFPAILMFCCIGIYSINSLPTDVMFIGFFGLVGYC
jgi:putative tricarboxylic transport membrane protein